VGSQTAKRRRPPMLGLGPERGWEDIIYHGASPHGTNIQEEAEHTRISHRRVLVVCWLKGQWRLWVTRRRSFLGRWPVGAKATRIDPSLWQIGLCNFKVSALISLH
jgi:hypothetical protein